MTMFDDFDEQQASDAFSDDDRAKAAARADAVAMTDHRAADATARHELLSRLVWRSLRTLGIGGGRMLVIGQDPEVFAGLPASERRLVPGSPGGFAATIPSDGWPHAGLQLRLFNDDSPRDERDVVIAIPHYSDVALHRPGAVEARRIAQTLGIVGSLANTEPGGYTIALTAKEVLDDPDREGRNLLAGLGELVGAVRLPAGALRKDPGNDASVDLLLLRRHYGDPVQPHTFLPARQHRIDGHPVQINEYYLDNPHHVLGRLSAHSSPWGPPELTVLPAKRDLHTGLAGALTTIVEYARYVGLTANTEYSVDFDAPIGYAPVDQPKNVQGVELDTTRARIQQLRAKRQPRGVGNDEPDRSGLGPTRRPGPRSDSGPDALNL
jgi:hypothetical protein